MLKPEIKKIIEQISSFIETTQNQHYSLNGGKNDVADFINSLNYGEGYYIGNVIKYLSRYGKKNGKNKNDLFKAVHYLILLILLNHGSEEVK